jgi:hypothetical protein
VCWKWTRRKKEKGNSDVKNTSEEVEGRRRSFV